MAPTCHSVIPLCAALSSSERAILHAKRLRQDWRAIRNVERCTIYAKRCGITSGCVSFPYQSHPRGERNTPEYQKIANVCGARMMHKAGYIENRDDALLLKHNQNLFPRRN